MKHLSLSKSIENNKLQTDIFISLIPLIITSLFFYGLRPLVLICITAFYGLLSDYIISILKSQKNYVIDISTINHSIILCLLLPATIPYWMVSFFNIFANLLCKHIMGDRHSTAFNQPTLAFCFLAIFFPKFTYSYPKPFSPIDLITNNNNLLVPSPSSVLKESGIPYLSLDNLILGDYAGPLGASFVIVILSCAYLLIYKKRIEFQVPLTFLSTIIIFSLFIPRIITGRFDSVIYELLSQPMIFISVFIVSDESLLPKKYESKILYTFTLAIMCMAFEYSSPYNIASMFAILLLNPMTEYFDRVITPFILSIDSKKICYNLYDKFFKTYLENKGVDVDKKEDEENK